MKEMAKNYGKSDDDKEFMQNENVKNYIKSGIESEKALDFLVKNAKFTKAKKEEKKETEKKETSKK